MLNVKLLFVLALMCWTSIQTVPLRNVKRVKEFIEVFLTSEIFHPSLNILGTRKIVTFGLLPQNGQITTSSQIVQTAVVCMLPNGIHS